MKSLIFSIITATLAISAAGAAEPATYKVCQDTTKAIILSRCVNAAEVVLNDDTKAAEAACADNAPGSADIQQCILAAKAVISDDIDDARRSRIAAVACSGGTERAYVQRCLANAEVVMDNNDTEAGKAMAAAIACSGGSEFTGIQRCIANAHAVSDGSPWEKDLTAAFACSGNTKSNRVQYCINNHNFEIKEASRFQLILDLIGAK